MNTAFQIALENLLKQADDILVKFAQDEHIGTMTKLQIIQHDALAQFILDGWFPVEYPAVESY